MGDVQLWVGFSEKKSKPSSATIGHVRRIFLEPLHDKQGSSKTPKLLAKQSMRGHGIEHALRKATK